MNNQLDTMGPIDYLVVEFPVGGPTGEAFPLLVDLVDRGLIRILDLAFVTKEQDGSVRGLSIADLYEVAKQDLAAFEGASSRLLGQDDFVESGAALEPGRSGAILV